MPGAVAIIIVLLLIPIVVCMSFAAIAFIFRPGAKRHADEAAQIPLKED